MDFTKYEDDFMQIAGNDYSMDIYSRVTGQSLDIRILLKKAKKYKLVILICGPTCTGKSRIAALLAGILSTDLISVDSMQVYKGMDIGTDKYNVKPLGIKQYMVDIVSPEKNFTVVEFRKICRNIIEKEFFRRKKIPVLAGGSGLYIRAVIDDLGFIEGGSSYEEYNFTKEPGPVEEAQLIKLKNCSNADGFLNTSVNEKFREEISKQDAKKLYLKLQEVDPGYASKISSNDKRRILRALEVYEMTGKTFSSFQVTWNQRKSVYRCVFIGLTSDKEQINSCIEQRVTQMFERGLIEEVKDLVANGYEKYNSLKQAVGYKEVIKYLKGESSLEECSEEIIANTKKLVKKQLTWFKADPRINWLRTDNYDNISDLIISILNIVWRELYNEKA